MSRTAAPVGTIAVTLADGSSYDVPIQAPGSAIRFSVGTRTAHALIWRLWSSPKTTDVYLSVRDKWNGGDAKYSFHASGDWRLQYEYSKAQELGTHRVLERWTRPAPDSRGAIDVTRILTPSDDVVPNVTAEPDADKVRWILEGQPGTLHILPILLVPSGEPFSPPSDADLVAAMALTDGSLLLLLHAINEMQPFEADIFQRVRVENSKYPPPGSPSDYVPRADPEYRCEVSSRAADSGEHSIWDLLM